jgi:hypothetical protein
LSFPLSDAERVAKAPETALSPTGSPFPARIFGSRLADMTQRVLQLKYDEFEARGAGVRDAARFALQR